jgi:hypothetical protein
VLDNATTAVLPEATCPLRTAVQVVLLGVASEDGLQTTDVRTRGEEPDTVIVPPIPVTGIAEAANEAAKGLATARAVVLALAATVTATVATTPFWRRLELSPSSRQV